MGFFLWGVTFGWGLCALFWWSQSNEEKPASAASIIFVGLLIMAAFISINLGIASGYLPSDQATPTPTFGER